MSSTPTILMNITHGFQARMLLRTAICEELLKAGARIVVVSPNANETYFKEELEKMGVELLPMPKKPSVFESLVANLRQYLLMNPALGGTLNFKREKQRRETPVRFFVGRVGNKVLGRNPALRKRYLAKESEIFDGSEFDELLKRVAPSLVVSGTPGFNVMDAHILRAASRLKMQTATVMLSWDNLTSKGYMAAVPDHLLVWSALMHDEAIRYHDYVGEVHEVGAAQFDHYPEFHRDKIDVKAAKRKLGIPVDKHLLTFGTINRGIYKEQLFLLEEMVEDLKTSSIANDLYLWVRLHPQSVVGAPEADITRLKALECDWIKIEFPEVRSKVLAWDVPKSDGEHLARLLGASDVVIVPRSTLSIDAACVDRPIINLAIDSEFRRGFAYTHYKNIVKSKGVWIVRSRAELKSAIERYILDPELHRIGRARIVKQQLGDHLGNAGKETAKVLLRLASDG